MAHNQELTRSVTLNHSHSYAAPKHLHYIVQAFASAHPEGSLTDVCTLDLIAYPGDKAEDIIERARLLIDKPFYRVSQVIEHFNDQPCGRA